MVRASSFRSHHFDTMKLFGNMTNTVFVHDVKFIDNDCYLFLILHQIINSFFFNLLATI